MTARPAAGPLTCNGEPASAPTTMPPMMPVIRPFSAGTPDATAMPMHRGIATRNTTMDAVKSRTKTFGRELAPADEVAEVMGNSSGDAIQCFVIGKARCVRKRYRQRRVVSYLREVTFLFVERQDGAGVDIDEPAVQSNRASRDT